MIPAFRGTMLRNGRWYPHPSLTRGTLKLSRPKALAYGVDPGKVARLDSYQSLSPMSARSLKYSCQLSLGCDSALSCCDDDQATKDHGHECPFFEGNKHRFKDVQSLPEAQLRESLPLVGAGEEPRPRLVAIA